LMNANYPLLNPVQALFLNDFQIMETPARCPPPDGVSETDLIHTYV
jgi:hypothetical protein